ncbi:MAG: serine/threonine-protein kinase [Cyanobacteria bacterium J06560_5]
MVQFSTYRLLGLVGQGQFAQVYCGVHRRTGKLVAIKLTRHASEQASQEPFVLHDLNHPHVVGARAIAQIEDGYQFILDYCEGGTLRSHLDTAGPLLPFAEAKALIADILKGLSYIHQQQIIHGDLKPENILLSFNPDAYAFGSQCLQRSGAGNAQDPASANASFTVPFVAPFTAKIGDFGSARFIELPNASYKEIGSPTYAAPERFSGRSSYASDLYSVGVILYELLLGERPFSGSPEALRTAHQTQPIPLPETLCQPAMQLLITALHKQPSKRFASAEAMLDALEQLSQVYLATPKVASCRHVPDSTVEQISIAPALTQLSIESVAQPIESLVTVPQGCYLITARSLTLLTLKHDVIPVAQFDQDCWSVISPDGQWCVALPKQSQRQSKGRFYKLRDFKAVPTAPVMLTSPLLTALRSDVVQVLAIDSRHLLRVRTVQPSESADATVYTYLECFTRRGQFVGQLALALPIIHMTPTAVPYQFVALSAPTASTPSNVFLITLKPFQIRHLRLSLSPCQVSAFDWGCVVVGQTTGNADGQPVSRHQALLLDRAAEPVDWLTDMPAASAIAAVGHHSLLIAPDSSPSAHSSPPAHSEDATQQHALAEPTSLEPTSLWIADFTQLPLSLIF